ncbi:MAG TPA: transposase, partial [Rhodanobacter sp.]
MAKYSPSFKREVVLAHLKGTGHKAVAIRYGVDRAEVRHWTALYRQHGSAGLDRRPPRQYSAEFKLQVLQHMWREKLSCYQATALYGIRSKRSVPTWERLYHEGGIEALTPRRGGHSRIMAVDPPPLRPPSETGEARTREELLKENERLRAEVADVPPALSSTAVWSPIPQPKEIGREETLF